MKKSDDSNAGYTRLKLEMFTDLSLREIEILSLFTSDIGDSHHVAQALGLSPEATRIEVKRSGRCL